MAIWTDLIDPATLTGYVRASMNEYEARKGTLARWLPNQTVADTVVRFVAGQSGLVDIARFRAYDAEPEIGKVPGGKRVTLELPALGTNLPLSEVDQLRSRNASPDAQLKSLLKQATLAGHAASDAMEYMRGIVLNTGIATIAQDNFATADDFGRSSGHTVTLSGGNLWSAAATVDRLGNLQTWSDTYLADTGEVPGAIVMSTRVFRSMAAGNGFATVLANGAVRPATGVEANAVVEGAGLPPIYLYDRRVSVGGTSTKVIPDDRVLLLPAPVDPNDAEGSALGGSWWGQTLTSESPLFGIEPGEEPGIVVGAYRGEKPPMIAEVIADAIGLPVLANADLSFAAKVL